MSEFKGKLTFVRRAVQGYMNSLDWSRVLDYWNGPLEWTTGLVDYWTDL